MPVLLALSAALAAQERILSIPFAIARPVLEALREDLRPALLRGRSIAEAEAAWPSWVASHDRGIRARLERGDDDAIINFLLFGVTFTKEPRITERDMAADLAGRGDVVSRRVEDMIAGTAAPGSGERLEFVRAFVGRRGIDPATEDGKAALRRYLTDGTARLVAERREFADRAAAAVERLVANPSTGLPEVSTLFADRGLSSDTSIFVDYAVDAALEAMRLRNLLPAGSVRRVAIVGPGLDFTDKREGFDFYPQQTMQPFAVYESLVRRHLAPTSGIRIAAFDVSARVIQHIDGARRRAAVGESYVLHLPRDTAFEWNPNLLAYWRELGTTIGEPVNPLAPPAGVPVEMRAVRVRPEIVRAIEPMDVNIVVQRVETDVDDRLDLIVATNVLVYYDVFEQSLALTNIASMLRPGGVLLTNNPLFLLPSIPLSAVGYTDVVYSTQASSRDRVFWYRRDE